MQPGYPGSGQDPYGQQPPYSDPYAQPQYPPQAPTDPYAQPQPPYADPYAQPQPTSGGAYPTSGGAYPPTSGSPYPPPQPAYPAYPQQGGYPMPGYGAPGGGQNNTLGLLGMIFGIISLPLALCCSWLGVPMGIAGAVLGGLGVKKANEGQASNRGMAMAGLICGGIGVVLSILFIILSLVLNFGGLLSP